MSRKRKNNKPIRRRIDPLKLDLDNLTPGHYLIGNRPEGIVVCPDCGGSTAGDAGPLDHKDGCPLATGYHAAAEEDAAWFSDHPEATERRRPPLMAEVQAVMLQAGMRLPDMPGGVRYEAAGEVVVTQVRPGSRMRDFSRSVLIAEPTTSDAQCS